MSKPDTSRVDVASWQEGIEADTFPLGTPVEKYTGEAQWRGVVVSSYQTTHGKRRYVVEVEPQGFQMIAVPSQLRAITPPERAASPSGESGWRETPDEILAAFTDVPPAPHVPAQAESGEPLLSAAIADRDAWVRAHATAEARIRELEAEAAASRAEMERLTKERDDADRRAGAAERTMERLREDAVSRADWLWKAKRARGYSQNTSFDVVWAETCKSADRAASLEAIVREIVPPNGFNVDPELLERARALLDPTVSNTKEDGHGR